MAAMKRLLMAGIDIIQASPGWQGNGEEAEKLAIEMLELQTLPATRARHEVVPIRLPMSLRQQWLLVILAWVAAMVSVWYGFAKGAIAKATEVA